jgi:site-specific recombinase XerC
MSQDTPDLEPFLKELERTEGSAHTIRNYRQDLLSFIRFFEGSTGEPFRVRAITPTDIREYRSYLLNVKGLKPATINRHLGQLAQVLALGPEQAADQGAAHRADQRGSGYTLIPCFFSQAGSRQADPSGGALRQEA